MRTIIYPALALIAFVAATAGADVYGRYSIAEESIRLALSEHIYWAVSEPVLTAFLFAPFAAVAAICISAQRRAFERGSALIFIVAIAVLVYFYASGRLAAQQALQEERWTAAALSVGLLPFLIGIPVVLAALVAWAVLKNRNREASD